MELILRKYGNSTALSFPPSLLRELGLKAGQVLIVTKSADGLLTLTPKRRHSLADLIAQCDIRAAPPADIAIWDVARPVGKEIL